MAERMYGRRPDASAPIWSVHPYYGFPRRPLIAAGSAEHFRTTTPGLWLTRAQPAPGDLGERGYMLAIGSRSVAVRWGDDVVGTHTGAQVYVAPDHRRRGLGLLLTATLLRAFPRAWRLADGFTPVALTLHHAAYRSVILEAARIGAVVHPAIRPFVDAHVDGTMPHFPLA